MRNSCWRSPFTPMNKRTWHRWPRTAGNCSTRRRWPVPREHYQRFIQGSKAEFGIAKSGYVNSRCGWISDRSLCYLASGRPVLAQETGFSHFIPVGEGLFAFQSTEDILAAHRGAPGELRPPRACGAGHRRRVVQFRQGPRSPPDRLYRLESPEIDFIATKLHRGGNDADGHSHRRSPDQSRL